MTTTPMTTTPMTTTPMTTRHERVLALSLRPKFLHDLVGQTELTDTLKAQFDSKRRPHFFIIHGPVGAGKTTLARILSLKLQLGDAEVTEDHWKNYKQFDIHEINAANRNGIDDVRAIVDMMRYQPMPPSRAKVVILDEAHQLTYSAQNALATETEDVADSVYYIFCTSAIEKIIPALRRRGYTLSPKPLTHDDTLILLQKAADAVSFKGALEPLYEALLMNSIASPGLILQATEKYFSGIPSIESVFDCASTKLDTMLICREVAKGNWKTTASLLKNMTKSDVPIIRNCVLGFLKTKLMSTSDKALYISNAIIKLSLTTGQHTETIEVPTFLASVCLACHDIDTVGSGGLHV